LTHQTVSSFLDDNTPGTLRTELAQAAPGGVVVIPPGTVTLTSPITLAQNVTIRGAGAGATIISGGGTTGLLIIAPGVNATVGQLTLTQSGGQSATAVVNQGSLQLRDTAVTANGSYDSTAGIANTGTMTIARSTISGNTSELGVGGIENDGTLTVLNSAVNTNASYNASGGISNDAAVTLTNVTMTGNTGRYWGTLANWSPGTATVIRSTVVGYCYGVVIATCPQPAV
jgi:hypothetical protein